MKAQITLNANFTFTTNSYVPGYVSRSLDRATEIFFCVAGGERSEFAKCVTSYLGVLKSSGYTVSYSRKIAALIAEGREVLAEEAAINEEAGAFEYARMAEAA